MYKFALIFLTLGFSLLASAQKSEEATDAMRSLDGDAKKAIFKARQPAEDKTETIEVTGLGQTTHFVSNMSDGTTNSFRHTVRLVAALQTPAFKGGTVQLVFYSPEDRVRQAAENENGVISIYYPLAVYESLRGRLEQALQARKRVQLKVTMKTDGYREGVLVF